MFTGVLFLRRLIVASIRDANRIFIQQGYPAHAFAEVVKAYKEGKEIYILYAH